jgi:hypothetical protein
VDPQATFLSMRLPTRLDRYPAKMVSRLAENLIERYALDATRLLDPFSGSGAVLAAASNKGIPVSGVDINPVSGLLSRVKLKGFSPNRAIRLAGNLVAIAREVQRPLDIQWSAKHYWFTQATLLKFERLRAAATCLGLERTDDGTAVLLSYALSVRLCSRADQRSPKPFISKQARKSRSGKHFDPYSTILMLLHQLAELYGSRRHSKKSRFLLADVVSGSSWIERLGMHSHVITSPPYINAQDYFRNFKLELYLLEDMLPFKVSDIRERFIGTERGDLLQGIPANVIETNCSRLLLLRDLSRRAPRLANVVHRYLYDMGRAFDAIRSCLEPKGKLVLVCGDNLIGGFRIQTWKILRQMLEDQGFVLFDTFSDRIGDRLLAPKRSGHKGLIKEEVVCAFRAR